MGILGNIEMKEWYKSRTIWTGILTAVFGTLKSMDMIPAWFESSMIDELAGVCLGIATIYFRATAEKLIAPVAPAA